MTYLDHCIVSVRSHRFISAVFARPRRRFHHGSTMIVAAVIASYTMTPNCQAAQVTYRFDAEIVNVPTGNPFDLPLTYQIGDVIHGKMMFDTSIATPAGDNVIVADQPFELQFDINGATVGSLSHRIEVFNDTVIDDSEFEGLLDTMTIGCSEPSCIPDLVRLPDGEPFRVRSRLNLVGDSSILAAPEISADPATWNSFSLERRLFLGFDDVGPGSMGLDAVVGPMVLVPEPRSVYAFLIAVGVASICTAFRRLRHDVKNQRSAQNKPTATYSEKLVRNTFRMISFAKGN